MKQLYNLENIFGALNSLNFSDPTLKTVKTNVLFVAKYYAKYSNMYKMWH